MTVQGQSLIASAAVAGTAGSLRAVNAGTGEAMDPQFGLVSQTQLEQATSAAAEAFLSYRRTTPEERARFLERIAENIEGLAAELTARGVAETGLPEARLNGERGRTTGQLRLFAQVLRLGDHQDVRIDPAQPDREPLPAPDLRSRQVPLGPVAVFGASNFPLAFSTAGGDTASALAAGCPVVVKGHNAHPGTAELVGRAISQAVTECELPAGVFSLVFGEGNEIGQSLVSDPHIRAVGFTGSRAGGLALARTASERARPIPVYAEMSSINPVFLLPDALAENAAGLAESFVGSLTMGAGQFCTGPGLLFVPDGPEGDTFAAAAAEAVKATTGQTMLTPGIAAAYTSGVEELSDGIDVLAQGSSGGSERATAPALFSTTLAHFADNEELQREVFGSASVIVRYADLNELLAVLATLEGQLTATVHATEADHEQAEKLLPVLEEMVGRVIFNGWPTGVEVNHAMVHGGPFPATTDSRVTSVGSAAIYRFQRPVAYQDLPDTLLPPALQEGNPWGLNRRISGELRQD